MVVIRQVKAFDVPALFSPKPGNVKCSVDNRVIILHRKGAAVYEVIDDPSPDRADVVTRKSILEVPKVESLSVGASENVLVGGTKRQILELLRDRIITPRGYQGIEFNNFFVKAEWSPAPVTDGPSRKPRCVLASITSNFQLTIQGQTEEGVKDLQRNWVVLLNISKLYGGTLQEKWAAETEGMPEGLRFQQYKKRLYELTSVDFTWMPQWDEEAGAGRGANELFLITAQADGTIVIWWILVSAETLEYTASPVFSQYAFENEIVSTMKFHRVTAFYGLLAIGTNNGAVRVFKVERQKPLETDPVEPDRPIFSMSQGIEVWEKDALQIDHMDFVTVRPEETNILKSLSLDLLFIKHPYYVCSVHMALCNEDLVCQTVVDIQIPEGPIVGIDRYSDDLFMMCHESGILSLVYLKNGNLKYLEASSNSIRDITSNSLKPDRYIYNGFAFSSNKALAFVGKHLTVIYNHILERDPGKLILFSTLPHIGTWDAVKQLYAAQGFSLTRIADALLAFRFQIRVKKDYDIDQYLDGPGPLDISPEFLRLYYWVLRCMQLPRPEDWMKEEALLDKRAEILHRQTLVEDRLLQTHFSALLERLNGSEFGPEEAQSLSVIQKYVGSKPGLGSAPILGPAFGSKPVCAICSTEIDFMDMAKELVPEVRAAEREVAGFLWSFQQCFNRHRLPICILSLLPCLDNFRTCDICHVIAMAEPVFGQKPTCPLCGSYMYMSKCLEDEVEGPCDVLEDDDELLEDDVLVEVKVEQGFPPETATLQNNGSV